jgi:polyferredoxin
MIIILNDRDGRRRKAVAESFDVTARKFHQAVCVALLAVAFVIGAHSGLWLVALVGAVLLLGRFWWPADLFRQFNWRVLEPAGILKRREAQEDHETRRIARVMGGVVLLVSAVLLGVSLFWAWVFVALMGIMIFLDAAFDF